MKNEYTTYLRSNVQISGTELRDHLVTGLNKIANAVKSTIGPGGTNVFVCEADNAPIITKDGVSVAYYVVSDDVFENAAINLARDVSKRACDVAGDGTTTAMVLAQAIVNNITEAAPDNFIECANGARFAADAIVNNLKESSIEATDEVLEKIAFITANGDMVIAETSVHAVALAGLYGKITLEMSNCAEEDEVICTDGFTINHGLETKLLINDPATGSYKSTDEHLLYITTLDIDGEFVDGVIKGIMDSTGGKNVVLIGAAFDKAAIQKLTRFNNTSPVKLIPLRGPGYGQRRYDQTEDLAVYTGGYMITEANVHDMTIDTILSSLATVSSIVIDGKSCQIKSSGGNDEAIAKRLADIENMITITYGFEQAKAKERLAGLACSLVRIIVGGYTAASVSERYDRFDDAVKALASAREHGVLPGAGMSLIRNNKVEYPVGASSSFIAGVNAVVRACSAPAKAILDNAGILYPWDIIQSCIDDDVMFDVRARAYTATSETSVYDATLVTTSAIRYATDIASIITTTNVGVATYNTVVNAPNKK